LLYAQFEVREDEEQAVKLGQIIDLLLAAGYFRVRIKGLSSFDKVIIVFFLNKLLGYSIDTFQHWAINDITDNHLLINISRYRSE